MAFPGDRWTIRLFQFPSVCFCPGCYSWVLQVDLSNFMAFGQIQTGWSWAIPSEVIGI